MILLLDDFVTLNSFDFSQVFDRLDSMDKKIDDVKKMMGDVIRRIDDY